MNFVFENLETYENFTNCPDINASGIRRFTPSPVVTTIVRYSQNNDKFKNFNFKQVKCSRNPNDFKKYIIASGVTHSPHDWCGPDKENPNRKSLFSFLKSDYLRDLQLRKAFLLLDQSHEGYHAEWLYDWFHKECNEYNIDPEQVIYITGNMDAERQYNEWHNGKSFNKLCIIPHAHFENAVFTNDNNRTKIFNLSKLPDFNEQYAYKKKNFDKIKLFNSLQKRPRAHRMWLFKELCLNNLLEDSISSMNWFKWNHTYYMNKTMNVEDYNEIIKYLPMLPPHSGSSDQELVDFSHDDSGKYQMEFNSQITLDTWFTVISEASFGEDTCFISEKTFKLICVHHPFIIYGNKNSLHYLREMGYRTFHPYIDETYDSLECWPRLEAIINSIKKIQEIPTEKRLEWFAGMKEILEHNYKVMKENSIVNIPTSIITIDKYFKREE